MNVLSLFDGISCGQIALERAGIKVDNYYASEIDKNAIKVTQYNFPKTIQLGDVAKWKGWDIDWERVDLLCAGFPCQAWSLAGKQQGANDPRGALAITLFELFVFLKEKNPNLKFLFENVTMKKEYSDYLTNLFGVKPIKINSNLLSAQSRNRLYWTNLNILPITNKHIYAGNILENCGHEIPSDKEIQNQLKLLLSNSKYASNFKWSYDSAGRILVSRPDGLKIQRIGRVAFPNHKTEILTCVTQPFVFDGAKIRKVTPTEAERLQTLPDGYTSILTKSQRYKHIGNAWTVDVIAHIFSSIS